MSSRALSRDARNRALRSLLQGLVIDVLVAVALVVYTVTTSPDPVVWNLLAASVARTVAQSMASFVMRRFADPSGLPTPLPPEPGGEPNVDVPRDPPQVPSPTADWPADAPDRALGGPGLSEADVRRLIAEEFDRRAARRRERMAAVERGQA